MDGSHKQDSRWNVKILCEYLVTWRITKLCDYRTIPSDDFYSILFRLLSGHDTSFQSGATSVVYIYSKRQDYLSFFLIVSRISRLTAVGPKGFAQLSTKFDKYIKT